MALGMPLAGPVTCTGIDSSFMRTTFRRRMQPRRRRRRWFEPPVGRLRLNCDQRPFLWRMAGHCGGCQQVGDRDFVHGSFLAAQVAVHGVIFEDADCARLQPEFRSVNDDQACSVLDFGKQREAQRATVDDPDSRGQVNAGSERCCDMYARAVIGKQRVAYSKYQVFPVCSASLSQWATPDYSSLIAIPSLTTPQKAVPRRLRGRSLVFSNMHYG